MPHITQPGHRLRRLALAAVLLLSVGTAACTEEGQGPSIPGEEDDPANVHPVTRGEISSVVTLDARVESGAEVVIGAPESGSAYDQVRPAGTVIDAGDALARYEADGQSRTVTLPVEVEVTDVLVADGSSFEKATELMSVRLHRLAVVGTGDAATLYRLSKHSAEAKAQIVDGPGPFDCRVLGQVGLKEEQVTAACIPDSADLDLYPGLAGLLAVEVGSKDDVLTLPLKAVAGAADHGVVNRQVGDEFERVEVGLGLSDGARIEITQGLAEGDKISAVPPSLSSPTGPR